jgi:hypothetical protein
MTRCTEVASSPAAPGCMSSMALAEGSTLVEELQMIDLVTDR